MGDAYIMRRGGGIGKAFAGARRIIEKQLAVGRKSRLHISRIAAEMLEHTPLACTGANRKRRQGAH